MGTSILKTGDMHLKHRRLAAVALTVAALVAVPVLTQSAGANLAGSTFEGNDANLVVNTTGNTDWVNAPNRVIGNDLATGGGDNSFGNGTKEDNVNVTVTDGSIPNSKADLRRFFVANEIVNNQVFLYLGWTRNNESGTTNFDFEINKLAQPNLTTLGPKTLNRSVGDLLINYLFNGGAPTNVTLNVRTWTGTAWSAAAPLSGFSEGAVNPIVVTDPISGESIPIGFFGEASINLTAAGIIPSGTCTSFGSIYVKSRSSTAFDSAVKDFIAPVPFTLQNCGTLIVKKVTVPAGDTTTNFAFNETGPNSFTDSFQLKDGGSDTNTNLPVGTYTAAETDPGPSYVLTSATCDDNSPVTAISIAAGETVTCTFTNTLQQGAIKVSKTTKVPGQGTVGQNGVTFTVNGVSKVTANGGVACFDSLNFGAYDVTETVPAGYSADGANPKSVTVDNNAKCSDATYVGETVSFSNTPLTDLSVSVNSQADGGTASTMVCKDAANATIASGVTDVHGDGSASVTGLKPGTYVCTVVIDP